MAENIANHYHILEELGRGSFGVVYKALDKATGETVALKLIDLESSDDDIQEIQQEISVLSTCASPFVTQYRASFLHGHKLWIVMEYLGGGSCLDLLKPGNFSEGHVAIVCRELLRGLDYLHNEGKIHRDIKAANILLAETGKVKLADFGVAAQLTDLKSIRNTFVGTPFWMAPEVIQQAGYDFRADIWSLGITAIELVLGEPPHSKVHPMKVLLQIPKNPPPRLEGDFSRDFKDFVAHCLVKDPERRPSARELLRHRFIRSAAKVESLQELIERKRLFDASQRRISHPVYYQETLQTLTPRDDDDEWVFDTVKSMAPSNTNPLSFVPSAVNGHGGSSGATGTTRRATIRSRRTSALYAATEDLMRKLDVKDGPLQPVSPGPSNMGTVRRATTRRMPSSATPSTGSPRASLSGQHVSSAILAPKRPLQPDMSFGNSGSTMRLFRRVPSDGSTSGQAGSSPPPSSSSSSTPPSSFSSQESAEEPADENRPPMRMRQSSSASSYQANYDGTDYGYPHQQPQAQHMVSKEASLGHRLFTKVVDPTMTELHAQTSMLQKREALAKLSDAFAVLDAVDPEGAYHFMRSMVAGMAGDAKLSSAFLQGPSQPESLVCKIPDDGTPQGTVIIKSSTPAAAVPTPGTTAPTASTSPSKLVLSQANPHLKNHKQRRHGGSSLAADASDSLQPEKDRAESLRDLEKSLLQPKFPGREPAPGMQHSKQLSDVLYKRWVEGIRVRWPAV